MKLPILHENQLFRFLELNSGESLIRALLKLPQVCIRNPTSVSQKLESMINGGKNTLQIISDFDYTLSKITGSNGERLSTTHGVFDDNAKRIDPELGKKFEDLRAKFYPIEFSPNLSISEKIPFMEEWWRTSHEYILQSKFTKQQVRQFVDTSRKQNRIQLRDGVPAFLLALECHRIPLVLFSAGIGNVIEIYLDMELHKVPKNIHLISNMMRFDQQDVVASFSEPLIHTFCKNSSVIRDEHDFFHHIANRTHVLLLGDSLGDSHMDVGVERSETTIKIGFYNGNTQDTNLLEHYLEGYDIVLLQDDTMTVPQMILDEIVKEENSD
ncbi:hypothetical protein WR25_07708 isoform B [Diploscapter pachys]|uniref:5'-nucleotidase n=1 Tax=Diploscapter pachys TaxID=2018661 RepID=A0A2A2L1G5_9BILA|nr:hypothetical protein WR25_07708 isoform B [Diploscapter pachys]